MTVEYKLELFPTEGNWDKYVKWFGGETIIARTDDNAGVDLFCSKQQTVESSSWYPTLLDLGVKARMVKLVPNPDKDATEVPCHYWLAPRSSIWKWKVRQANSIGVIDKSYRGVLMGAVLPNDGGVAVVKEGDRLFQVLAPDMGYISLVVLRPLDDLDETSRGEGGFGSTGK